SQLPDWAPKLARTAAGSPAIPRIQRIRAEASTVPDLDQEWQLALPPRATALERAAQSAPAESPGIATLKQELERAKEDAEMWRAEAQRTREHLEEARQLSAEDKSESGQATARQIFLNIIPVVDDLERALYHVPESLLGHGWVEGIEMVVK